MSLCDTQCVALPGPVRATWRPARLPPLVDITEGPDALAAEEPVQQARKIREDKVSEVGVGQGEGEEQK